MDGLAGWVTMYTHVDLISDPYNTHRKAWCGSLVVTLETEIG